jgi:hypothetical protein
MNPESTQPVTEMYTKHISGAGRIDLTTLPASRTGCLEIWEVEPPGNLGSVQACIGITSLFKFMYLFNN